MGRRDSGSRASRPKISALPLVGWTAESSVLTKVVLPAPFGPNSPKLRRAEFERYPINRPNSTPGPARAVDFGQIAGLDGILGGHSSLGYAGNREFVPLSGRLARDST